MAVLGPAVELDLGDDLRLHPGGRVRQLGLLGEGALLPLERLQLRLYALERSLVEARADVRREPELPLVPVADENRPERRARALAAGVAADDELGAPGRLDLQPRPRSPARLVAALLALADDALEAAFERRLLQGLAILRRVHELHPRRGQEALREITAPVAIRGLAQVDAGEPRQVEAVEDARHVLLRRGKLGRRLRLDPVLQRVEGRLAGRVERDDLPVEDHPADRLPAELLGQARERRREVEAAARAQLHRLAFDEGEHPVAVELG